MFCIVLCCVFFGSIGGAIGVMVLLVLLELLVLVLVGCLVLGVMVLVEFTMLAESLTLVKFLLEYLLFWQLELLVLVGRWYCDFGGISGVELLVLWFL